MQLNEEEKDIRFNEGLLNIILRCHMFSNGSYVGQLEDHLKDVMYLSFRLTNWEPSVPSSNEIFDITVRNLLGITLNQCHNDLRKLVELYNSI